MQTHEMLHYPDVFSRGTMEEAYERYLAQLEPPLSLADNAHGCHTGQRYCGTLHAADQRLFILDFSDGGVRLANLQTSSLETACQSLHSWVARRLPIAAMQQQYPEFEPTSAAQAFEQGTYVEERWQMYLSNSSEWPHMAPFIKAASENPILRGLFPFFAMQRLRFSRSIGFPYVYSDVPQVRATAENCFLVERSNGSPLGQGDVQRALEILLQHTPPDIGPAV